MAIYHCSIKIVSRGNGGKSAVAAAAYRAAEKIKNEYDGMTHDYTRKRGVIYTEILLPDNAPPEFSDRATLWNEVEKIEKAKNSQLAREIEIALPVELTREQNIFLVREYVKEHFVNAGMCADVCVHDKKDGNPHAHIMLTMRPFNEDKTWGAKQKKEYILNERGEKIYDKKKRQYKCKSIPTTDWNEQTKAEEWREAWAKTVNNYFEKQGTETRIDHRSYERQGIDKIPTIHLGVAAHQMERRGIRTERGNINRDIEVTNQQLRQLKARINKLKIWLKEEAANTEPPTLADVIQNILNTGENKSRYQSITNLKAAAKMFSFLQQNNIMDLTDLENKVISMYAEQGEIRDKLKPVERRLNTLKEHFKQAEFYTQYKSFYDHWQKLPPKKQPQYYEDFRRELTLFEAAKRHFDKCMKAGYKGLPIKKWKAEQAELTAKQAVLYNDYKELKEEVNEVTIIQRNIKDIIRENRPQQRTRGQDLEI